MARPTRELHFREAYFAFSTVFAQFKRHFLFVVVSLRLPQDDSLPSLAAASFQFHFSFSLSAERT